MANGQVRSDLSGIIDGVLRDLSQLEAFYRMIITSQMADSQTGNDQIRFETLNLLQQMMSI